MKQYRYLQQGVDPEAPIGVTHKQKKTKKHKKGNHTF